jgi:hypothetical protein
VEAAVAAVPAAAKALHFEYQQAVQKLGSLFISSRLPKGFPLRLRGFA